MSAWQKTGISGDTIRRRDGAYVHRFCGNEWVAYVLVDARASGVDFVPLALKDGDRLRKFDGADAAKAAIDALAPL